MISTAPPISVPTRPLAPFPAVSASEPLPKSGNCLTPMSAHVPCFTADAVSTSPIALGNLPAGKNAMTKPTSAWTTLFKQKPRNAGKYVSKKYNVGNVNDLLVPPQEVVDAGVTYWNNTLVGFFLDENLPYSVVKNYLTNRWRLKGGVKVKFDKDMYFFDFSSPDERRKILDADPYIIFGKPFIITQWSPTIDSAREQVMSIPVWVKFYNIPSLLQPLEGIDWLACRVGELICFDEITESRERLEFAGALIEITPDKPLPTRLSGRLSGNRTGHVDISYPWKPLICTYCCSFGHIDSHCSHQPLDDSAPPPPIPTKVPLSKPPPMQWRVKKHVDKAPLEVPVMSTTPIQLINYPTMTSLLHSVDPVLAAIPTKTGSVPVEKINILKSYLATAPSSQVCSDTCSGPSGLDSTACPLDPYDLDEGIEYGLRDLFPT